MKAADWKPSAVEDEFRRVIDGAPPPMRVLLLNQVFYPDVAATAQHADDLARHLTAHGHEVVAIASRSVYGESGATLPKREVVDGIEIRRVGRSWFGKSNILGRLIDFLLFYAAAAVMSLRVKRPDVVVAFTTPPYIGMVGWLLRLLRRCRFVYWCMDLYPDAAVACEVLSGKSPAVGVLDAVNRFIMRRADRVVVLGRCMRDRVLGKGIDEEQVELIGVWSDGDELKPIERSSNPYRKEWGLGDAFVVMYSGNFGLGHDVETMCLAAERLREREDIRFVFVGGGRKKAEVERFVAERGLGNAVLAPYQPREKLAESLSCADVHLATLLEGAEGALVPCKLFGIMAAARPTAFIGHPDSELARVLEETESGRCIRQGDVDGLVSFLEELASDRTKGEAMGARAQEALARVYSRERACEAWRELLESLTSERSGAKVKSNAEERAA
jgi:colanic acid biosynthesis glycosyl transferase WcaI